MAPPVVCKSSFADEEVPRDKQSYRLVRLADDESSVADSSLYSNDPDEPLSRWQHLLHQNLVPDACFQVKGIRILDGVEAVRFLKFVILTFVGILFVHWLVRVMNWERDGNYSLSDLIVYDSGSVLLDIMSFFVVGRLFRKNGIDNLAFVLVVFTSAIYTSTEYKFRFLRYSVSLFEIHCLWPWKLWVFVGILIPLVIVIVFKHVQYAMQHGLLVSKLVELTLSVLFFLVPVVSNSNFHFHHWYAGWLVGMHCSFDTWWSRATMAWFWGMYIQGIGCWGRDPILTCAYAYFISTDSHCPYMSCNLKPDNSTTPHYEPLARPDWRNCSGYIP